MWKLWHVAVAKGRAGDHEQELEETFNAGNVGEQKPVRGEEKQQPDVPCGGGSARGVRNNILSSSLLPAALVFKMCEAWMRELLRGKGKAALGAVEAAQRSIGVRRR
jgi:hypothetical protein